MPRVTFLPMMVSVEVDAGTSVLEASMRNGVDVDLDHACGGVCACSTCHVIIRQGYPGLTPATEEEEDQLDEAVGLTPTSRLACQTLITEDIVVEIPRHSRNLVSEPNH